MCNDLKERPRFTGLRLRRASARASIVAYDLFLLSTFFSFYVVYILSSHVLLVPKETEVREERVKKRGEIIGKK